MKQYPEIPLYVIRRDVHCIRCGHLGAVQLYGCWYPEGLGDRANCKSLEKYRDREYMDHALGFGGIIPWECMNCGNKGLIDIGSLEGYKKAFEINKGA